MATPPDDATTPATQAGTLETLLALLVPTEQVTVRDIDGTAHHLRPVLPVARQIKVARCFDLLMKREVVKRTIVSAGAGGGGIGDLLGAGFAGALALAADEDSVGLMMEAFAAAYPQCGTAAEAAERFGLEEVASALAPLLVRPLAKALAAMRPVINGTGAASLPG